jgi:tRNA-dihydrouridine synthase C
MSSTSDLSEPHASAAGVTRPIGPDAAPRVTPGVPAIILAPMEGVADAPMRALLTEAGGFTFCVAEFLRISQDVPPSRTFHRHMPELAYASQTPAGVPVQFQLLGGDADKLARAASIAVTAGAQAIDLNFGCPAPTVNRRDGGASLLRDPQRLRTIVAAVRQAVPAAVPVSAKLRLGWDDASDVHHNADMAAEGGAAWITLHGRTRVQNYRPWARWRPIAEVRRRLPIPVVANGDLFSVGDVLRCRQETGCIHFMLGRGALANPCLPRQAALALHVLEATAAAGDRSAPPDWAALMRRLVALAQRPEQRPSFLPGRLKQWGCMAHRQQANAWYPEIKRLQSTAEILDRMAALAP